MSTVLLFIGLTIGGSLLSYVLGYGLSVLVGASDVAMISGITAAVSCFVVASIGSVVGCLLISLSR